MSRSGRGSSWSTTSSGTTIRSVGVSGLSRTVQRRPSAGPIFQLCRLASVTGYGLGSSVGSSRASQSPRSPKACDVTRSVCHGLGTSQLWRRVRVLSAPGTTGRSRTRDLGLVTARCPCGSGTSEGCSSPWLPAWLPGADPRPSAFQISCHCRDARGWMKLEAAPPADVVLPWRCVPVFQTDAGARPVGTPDCCCERVSQDLDLVAGSAGGAPVSIIGGRQGGWRWRSSIRGSPGSMCTRRSSG